MNFKDAYQKMQEIADGKYNSVRYDITSDHREPISQNCQLYIDPSVGVSASTWEEAFALLDAILNPQDQPVVEVPSIPELEDGQ